MALGETLAGLVAVGGGILTLYLSQAKPMPSWGRHKFVSEKYDRIEKVVGGIFLLLVGIGMLIGGLSG